mmetsp:Transcript_5999/g.37208  ORF Transcript_5999/g.37208 Transcript_5999/m.37208 type:complete len:269 (+) Transcript_5999:3321-4127(+)
MQACTRLLRAISEHRSAQKRFRGGEAFLSLRHGRSFEFAIFCVLWVHRTVPRLQIQQQSQQFLVDLFEFLLLPTSLLRTQCVSQRPGVFRTVLVHVQIHPSELSFRSFFPFASIHRSSSRASSTSFLSLRPRHRGQGRQVHLRCAFPSRAARTAAVRTALSVRPRFLVIHRTDRVGSSEEMRCRKGGIQTRKKGEGRGGAKGGIGGSEGGRSRTHDDGIVQQERRVAPRSFHGVRKRSVEGEEGRLDGMHARLCIRSTRTCLRRNRTP